MIVKALGFYELINKIIYLKIIVRSFYKKFELVIDNQKKKEYSVLKQEQYIRG